MRFLYGGLASCRRRVPRRDLGGELHGVARPRASLEDGEVGIADELDLSVVASKEAWRVKQRCLERRVAQAPGRNAADGPQRRPNPKFAAAAADMAAAGSRAMPGGRRRARGAAWRRAP